MSTATIHEAKTHFSRFIREVQAGGELVITQRHKPVARLVGLDTAAVGRPRIGVCTSGPVDVQPGAWDALDDARLKDWGL